VRPAYGLELFENCLTCKWRRDHFFCNLAPSALKEFDALTFANVYPGEAVLYSEGQSPRGVFLLCQGSAKLSVTGGDGRTLITRIAHPGELLGLSSVLSGNSYKATAETLEPSQVNFVRRDDFIPFLQRNPEAGLRIIEQLTAECEFEADHIRALGLSHSASEKLARLLLSWAEERGRPFNGTIRLQMLMTHEDISQMIGTSRETVTRLFKDFRDRKLITLKGSTLTIRSLEELKSLVPS
jgi:CRP/FNR family transcriptional regulator